MIKCFIDKQKVTVLGTGSVPVDSKYEYIPFPRPIRTIREKIKNIVDLMKGNYEKYIANQFEIELSEEFKRTSFDLIICHDLLLLPFALSIKKNASILFDAREYYPTHFNSSILWRLFYKGLNNYLCGVYIGKVDHVITVSSGLAKLYDQYFGVKPKVIQSWPEYELLKPIDVNPKKIKIVHHGNANPTRKLELMIELMDYVDDRFHLDMYLVNVSEKYHKYLKILASRRNNVTIKAPIPFCDLVKVLNQYDIGMFLVPPVTDNLKYVLPNKFFEFIQARLAIAIGPSPEMKEIVEQFDLGVVSTDFSPKALADRVSQLTAENIMRYKTNANIAATKFNADQNCKRLNEIVGKQ